MNSHIIEAICGDVLDVCFLLLPILVAILMIAEAKRGEDQASSDSAE